MQQETGASVSWAPERIIDFEQRWSRLTFERGGRMAELLGNRAINQKVAGLIPGRAK